MGATRTSPRSCEKPGKVGIRSPTEIPIETVLLAAFNHRQSRLRSSKLSVYFRFIVGKVEDDRFLALMVIWLCEMRSKTVPVSETRDEASLRLNLSAFCQLEVMSFSTSISIMGRGAASGLGYGQSRRRKHLTEDEQVFSIVLENDQFRCLLLAYP